MPRRKPTTKTDVIGSLDLNPEDGIGDYRQSLQQEQFFVKPPNWDSAGDSIEMLYIANVRENESMCELQRQLLRDAKRQTAINYQRTRKMYKIQERLRKRFIEVNGFIKDCADKKRSAEKAVQEETALHEELIKDINEFQNSASLLKTFRQALKGTVREFEPYERVLNDVVARSDIFVSPQDCIDRCDALMLAQVEINELGNKKLQEIEEMRQRMLKITSEAALAVLGLKNDLAKLERSYNQSRTLCLKWEKILSTCKDAIIGYDLNKDRTLDGIQTIYRILCKRRDKSAKFPRNAVEPTMDFIKREIELLNAVLREMVTTHGHGKAEKMGAHEGVYYC